MRLAERRAMLFNPDFWRILTRQMPPFADEQERQMLAALAKSTKVSTERVEAHYFRFLKVCMAIKYHLIDPGTGTIN